jgi:glycosyltransferase involved in cell wall biosynthesis
MKIAMLCSTHPVNDERVTHKQAKSLACLGYEVTVFGREPKEMEKIGSVSLCPLAPVGGGMLRRLFMVFRLYRAAKSWRPDIIVCHEPESALLGLILKRCFGMKMVFDSHECFQETFSWRTPKVIRPIVRRLLIALLKVLVRGADWVTVASPPNREFLSSMRVDNRVDILHNSPPIELFPLCNHDVDHPITVVHDGYLYLQRGLVQMLEAVAIVRQTRDIRFLIVGRVKEQDQRLFDEKVTQLGLANAMIIPGWKPWEEIGRIESQAQIGLICHQYTPNSFLSLNNKLYNYMSCGQAVIGPEGSVTADMIRKYNCGLCVDTSKPKDIADAILRLANNRDLRKRFGENGRKAIQQELGWHKMKEKLERIYGRLALELNSDTKC